MKSYNIPILPLNCIFQPGANGVVESHWDFINTIYPSTNRAIRSLGNLTADCAWLEVHYTSPKYLPTVPKKLPWLCCIFRPFDGFAQAWI